MEKTLALRFTELLNNVPAEELRKRLNVADDLDASLHAVYDCGDEQGRPFVFMSKQHYDALVNAAKRYP